jgi:hypothetical protein
MVARLSPLRADCPLPPGRFLILISVRGWGDPNAGGRIRLTEKFSDLTGNRTRDILAYNIVPQPTTLPHGPIGLHDNWYLQESRITKLRWNWNEAYLRDAVITLRWMLQNWLKLTSDRMHCRAVLLESRYYWFVKFICVYLEVDFILCTEMNSRSLLIRKLLRHNTWCAISNSYSCQWTWWGKR